jgi:CHAT domain-containing protein
MVAGVPCSVVSQWPVEDGSTAQQMKFLYQKLLEGMNVATVLQSSMKQMLDNGYNIKH